MNSIIVFDVVLQSRCSRYIFMCVCTCVRLFVCACVYACACVFVCTCVREAWLNYLEVVVI